MFDTFLWQISTRTTSTLPMKTKHHTDKRIWIILDISIWSVGKTKPHLLDLLSSTGEFIRFLLKENNFLPPSYGKDILIPHQEVLQWIQIPEIMMFTLFISL